MRIPKKYFVFLIAGNSVQFLFLVWIFIRWPQNPYEGVTKLGELDTGIRYCKVAIYTEDSWEYAQAGLLEILIDGRVEIPMYFFTNVDSWKETIEDFRIVKHPKKNIIGLIRKNEPNVVLMMHNFDTNEHWPRANFTESYESVRERGRSMRKSLGRSFVLIERSE